MAKEHGHIILFDGVCNLCNWSVRFVIKRDFKRKFRFAALQSDIGRAMVKDIKELPPGSSTIIYLKGDSQYIKSTAVLHILKEIGGFWQMLYIGIIIPKPIRDFFYNLIAKYRYRIFGKRKDCIIPGPEIKDRFYGQ